MRGSFLQVISDPPDSPPQKKCRKPILRDKDKRDIKASLGGSIPAILATSPLEVIKMNAQVTSHNVTIRGMFKDVYRTHGIRGFYKGLGVSLCGQPLFWVRKIPFF